MSSGPLDGLRVVECASFVAGPTGGTTLAQLGADVVRIDPLGGGSDRNRWPVAPDGESYNWTSLNRGKQSVAIDMRSPRGRELVVALATASGPGRRDPDRQRRRRAWLDHDALAGQPRLALRGARARLRPTAPRQPRLRQLRRGLRLPRRPPRHGRGPGREAVGGALHGDRNGAVFDALQCALQTDLAREADRYRLRATVAAVLRPWFAARDLARGGPPARGLHVLWGLYRGMDAVVAAHARGAHPVLAEVSLPGGTDAIAARSPMRWNGRYGDPGRAPRFGADTAYVLAGVLGLTSSEIGRLARAGIIDPPESPARYNIRSM